MNQARVVMGLIAGALFVLSAVAHAVLGWTQLRGQLAAAHVPPDLIAGIGIGWRFGGAAMLAFGCIVLVTFSRLLRGEGVALWPALMIAALYVVFGGWALLVSGLDPFFLVFIVPGLLVGAAAIPLPRPSTP